MQQIALVHELAHALADQHFNLEKFIDRANENDDAAMARLAVMEGQATWLMSEYLARRMGMSLKTSPAIAQAMSSQAAAAAGQFPVFDKAPLYVRETLLFPYTQGMLFQHAVFEKEDQAAFASVFRRPPASTQQIFHPEKYFSGGEARQSPSYRTLSPPATTGFWPRGPSGNWITPSCWNNTRARGKRSPCRRCGEAASTGCWSTRKMDTPFWRTLPSGRDASVARQFFELYRQVLKGKWKSFEVTAEGDGSLAGRGDDGYFIMRLSGARVTSLEGMKTPAEAKEGLR